MSKLKFSILHLLIAMSVIGMSLGIGRYLLVHGRITRVDCWMNTWTAWQSTAAEDAFDSKFISDTLIRQAIRDVNCDYTYEYFSSRGVVWEFDVEDDEKVARLRADSLTLHEKGELVRVWKRRSQLIDLEAEKHTDKRYRYRRASGVAKESDPLDPTADASQ